MTTKASPATLSSVQWTFPTVAAMQAETRIVAGDLVQTAGYRAAGDGGGAVYLIAATSGANNGGSKLATFSALLQANMTAAFMSSPLQWGAYGDGATDDAAAIQAWITHLASLTNGAGLIKSKAIYDFKGRRYALASGITFPSTINGAVVRDASFVAIGTWTSTNYLVTNGAGYSDFYSISLGCAKKCRGWNDAAGSGRCRFYSLQIYKMSDVGYHKSAGGGETRHYGTQITEYLTSDAEFATQANFVATGILINESDCKFVSCNIRWCGTCVEWTTGVQMFYDCHFVQGTAGAYARTNGRIFYQAPGSTGELFTYGCYFDNGYSEFHSDKINLDGHVVFDPADAAITDFFKFYAYQIGTPECRATANLRTNQWNNTANLFNWVVNGAFTWADDYSVLVSRLNGVMGSGGHVARVIALQNITEELSSNFNGNARAVTSGNIRALTGYKDRNTTGTVSMGSQGDNAYVGAPDGFLILNTMGIEFPGGVRSIVGDGSPEGAVTAPVSSRYYRRDGGAGTSFYVKESGSGNTGWVAK